MSGYRKLNLNELNFAKETVSFDDTIRNSEATSVPASVINGSRHIIINLLC